MKVEGRVNKKKLYNASQHKENPQLTVHVRVEVNSFSPLCWWNQLPPLSAFCSFFFQLIEIQNPYSVFENI